MKKLMTVMAAAATALFAIGAANADKGGADIEGGEFVAGNPLNLDANDYGTDDTTDGDLFWSMAETSDDIGVTISNYVGETSASTPIATRPDLFAEQENTKYLSLDTSAPLVRNMVGKNTDGSKAVDIEDGIYLDTLVKFTAADDVFGADALATGDKIAISYVEQSDEVDDPITNFVIRAGYIGANELTVKNYEAKLDGNVVFDKDAWHRLTVRTVPGIDAAGHVGFVVYVDETALVYADAHETIGDSVTLVGVAANVAKSVFPSAVDTDGDNATAITAASFSGTGAIDDVVFTKDTPDFIAASSAVPVSITLGTGVTGVTVTVGQETINPDDATATPLVFNLPAGTTSFSLAGTLDTGYQNFTAVFAEEDTTSTFVGGTVSFTGVSLAFTVKASRNNFNVFDENGDAISGTYETLSQVLAADGVAKIQLAYDYDVTAAELSVAETEVFAIDGNIVLDLNGKVLDGGDDNGLDLFYVTGSLTVIDSSVANTGKIVYGGTVFGTEGTLLIGAVDGDNGPTIDGVLFEKDAEGQIVRAKVLAEDNTTEEDAFAWGYCLGDGESVESDAVRSGDYWVVAPSGEEPGEDTEIAVPTAASNLTYNGSEQTGVAAGEGYTLTGTAAATAAGDYTATATLETGYVWKDGTKEAKTINWSIAKAEVTATVSLTVTEAKFDSAKTAVTDYTEASVSFGLGAPELVEDTDYTVAWSATEVTGAGTFTYKVSPVAGSNYTFTETSATLTITEGGEYPSYIDGIEDAEKKAAYEKKYDEWKAAYGDDTASAHEDAFLLNCAPANVDTEKAAFKFTKIAFEGGVWVVETTTKNKAGDDYNGEVVVTRYSDVGCTEKSETGSFFKAELK